MRRGARLVVGLIAAITVVFLVGSAEGMPTPRPGASLGPGTSSPGSAASASGSVAPVAASGQVSAGSSGFPTTGTSAAPAPGARPTGSAPASARGFRVRATIVPIGFPLRATAIYRYGPAWHAPRVGTPLPYESVRGATASGRLLRAHDGVDLQVRIGSPFLAAFSGVVVDPRLHWRPWAPALYGNVVVIESTEPTSPGYFAIGAHLSRIDVAIGEHVVRGQVVGLTGNTGNAIGTTPHLHFELRAPFKIDQTWGGVFRRLDVFDPMPSLRAADPHRR